LKSWKKRWHKAFQTQKIKSKKEAVLNIPEKPLFDGFRFNTSDLLMLVN